MAFTAAVETGDKEKHKGRHGNPGLGWMRRVPEAVPAQTRQIAAGKSPIVVSALRFTSRVVAALFLLISGPGAAHPAEGDIERGQYLVAAGGCLNCHTDSKAKAPAYSGGAALKTPFGDFFAPNITPHHSHGIGAWSEADFIQAMRHGMAPDGSNYFPVFPYTSFTGVRDADLAAMYAYLKSLNPVGRANQRHKLSFPFNWRFLLTFWKWLFFDPGPYRVDPEKSPKWNRGAYLVNALTHCGECHTGRNALGAVRRDLWLAGTPEGLGNNVTPNLTPDPESGLGRWTDDGLAIYLKFGMDPDGDFAGSLMADVIEHGTSKLTQVDIAAIVSYLRSLPPIENKIRLKN